MSQPKRFLFLALLLMLSAAVLLALKANESSNNNDVSNSNDTQHIDSFSANLSIDTLKQLVVETVEEGYFGPPLHGELTLSGSFGELRTNHFHAGLDIRTGGSTGKAVLAVADGYVARIKVGAWGYGKALYLQHPNGKQTVYGHLSKYNGDIQTAVIKRQYQQESYEMEWYPTATDLKVKKGDTIAWSGNTGGSGGPHLHFEIRDAGTGETLNPMLHGIILKDTIRPVLQSMYLFKLDKEYRHRQGYYPYSALGDKTTKLILPEGTYGIGIRWLDYFVDKHSKLGINYATLSLDGEQIFSQDIEKFSFDEGRLYNTHIDYPLNQSRGLKVVKLFQDEGNRLKFYESINKGFITLEKGEQKILRLDVRDLAGYKNFIELKLICGDSIDVFLYKTTTIGSDSAYVRSAKGADFKTNYASAHLPANSLASDAWVGMEKIAIPSGTTGASSYMVRFHYDVIPFIHSYTLSLPIEESLKAKADKLVMMNYNPTSKTSSCSGGKREGNFISASLKSFGHYYLKVDETAPVISVRKLSRSIQIKISDNLSGIDSYKANIDGKFVLLEYEPKSNLLFGTVPPDIKGTKTFTLVVKDAVGNTSELTRTYTIP